MVKKVGILLSSPKTVGGIYQYSLSMIDALNRIGKNKKIDICYFYTNKFWESLIPKKSKKVYIKKKIILKIFKRLFLFFYLHEDRHLKFSSFFNEEVAILNESNCDLIIFPSQDITSYQIKKKSISTIHDLMHIYEPHFKDYTDTIIKNRNIHYRLMCNAVDGIFVDSTMGKKHVLENFKINKNKLLVLPFVAPSYLKNFAKFNVFKKFNIPKKYFFYPAQFWEHKNHINLIKAISICNKKNPDEKINLVLCGAKKNYFNVIFDFIKKNKLCENIYYLGRVEDKYMASLYRGAYATIYPSHLGPTNIPPLEAISLGCPVICSNKYAMKKQLGKSALYFNPNSAKEIANQILIFIKTKNLREKLISQGKIYYNKYNDKHFSKKLEKFLIKFA
jgi:glycosyltransferase involved in cell wall biosynthesis